MNTDQRGEFEVSGLPMKYHELIPVAAGRVRQYVLFDTTQRPDAELEIRLPQGAVVKGRVLDQQSQPIAGTHLTRPASGMALTLNGWDEACQPDGSFEYGGLPMQRESYDLQVSAPGCQDKSISVAVNAPTDVIEREVRLQAKTEKPLSPTPAAAAAVEKSASSTAQLPRRTITGTVKDGDGHLVSGATIRWGTFQWDPSIKSVKTDADGKCILADTPANDGAILVLADGWAPQFVAAHAQDEQINVQLVHGKAVHGVVLGTSGKPVAGVIVIPSMYCFATGFANPIWLSEQDKNR